MRKALVFSIILHLAVVVLAYFGVPMAQKEFVAGPDPAAIDVVTVADTTNLPPPRRAAQAEKRPPAAQVAPKIAAPIEPKSQVNLKSQVPAKPQPPAPAKPEIAKVEPPKAVPPVQAKAPAPEAKPEKVPEAKPEKVPEAKPEKVPEAKPQQTAKAEAQPPRPTPPAPAALPEPKTAVAEPKLAEPKLAEPKPVLRGKPALDQPNPAAVAQKQAASAPTEEKPASAVDFQSVLNTVNTLARDEAQKPKAEAAKKVQTEREASQPKADKAGAASSQQAFQSLIEEAVGPSAETASASASGRTYDPSQQMTVSEIDEVRRQIERCWNVPAGTRDAGDHVVTIRVEMGPDATPRSATVLNETRTHGNAFHRAAAESALRAVLNPRCHPFRLPIEKYERWKTMTLVFNPKDMLGT